MSPETVAAMNRLAALEKERQQRELGMTYMQCINVVALMNMM